jgi:hypothetical protein
MVEADLKKFGAVETVSEIAAVTSPNGTGTGTGPSEGFLGLSTTNGIIVLGVATIIGFTLLFKSRK